jgi:hypothetical protein
VLALSALPGSLKQNPFCLTYFFPTAAKSKHKFFWKKFEHPQDGPKGEIQDVFHKKRPARGQCSSSNYSVKLAASTELKTFKVVNHTSLMIGIQSRLPAQRPPVELFNWAKPCF